MKVDAILPATELGRISALAREIERLGFEGLLVPEACHDPFLALALAAEHTGRLDIGTCVAAAFPRSPMHLAQAGHDLQTYCEGRLTLGLGADDPAELEERFGLDGSNAVERMREIVLAVRAIWRTWNEGAPLDFEGEFYRHTLMTPAFHPGPTGWGPPRIFLSARDAAMAEVAGEVADGLFITGPVSPRDVRDVILPGLEQGLHRSGRERPDVEVSIAVENRSNGLAPLHDGIGEAYQGLADRVILRVC